MSQNKMSRNKKFAIAFVVWLVVGLILWRAGAMETVKLPDTQQAEVVGVTVVETGKDALPLEDQSRPTEMTMELDAFTSIDLSAMAAHVELVEGKTNQYEIFYALPGKESIDRVEVVDGTLYVSTKGEAGWKPDVLRGDRWEIRVTVPEDLALNQLTMKNVAGDIAVKDVDASDAVFSTVSGHIVLEDMDARKATLEATAANLQLIDCDIDALVAKNQTGRIELDGDFGSLNVENVYGNIVLDGDVKQSSTISSVSGSIYVVECDDIAVEASTKGKILYQGQEQGNSFSHGTGAAVLTLQSTSGDIDLGELQ